MPQRQFANDAATPAPISVARDKYQNEIPTDKTNHDNTTPEKGAWSWDEGHYSTDFNAGFGPPYGTSVEDKGQNPSSERVAVDNSRADRGKEA